MSRRLCAAGRRRGAHRAMKVPVSGCPSHSYSLGACARHFLFEIAAAGGRALKACLCGAERSPSTSTAAMVMNAPSIATHAIVSRHRDRSPLIPLPRVSGKPVHPRSCDRQHRAAAAPPRHHRIR